MSVYTYELSDNRYLGVDIIEIFSFPSSDSWGRTQDENCKRLSNDFAQILTEIHKLSGKDTCIELIWMTEKVENQTFSSQIHIYCVLRKIDCEKRVIEYELSNLEKNIVTTLTALQFEIRNEEFSNSEFKTLLSNIDDSCVYAISKGERCISNSQSIYPYYFPDVIPSNNYVNFQTLVATLSQNADCCISFQLFPTYLTNNESYMITEVAGELERIANGTTINNEIYRDTMATEPLKVYSYYRERLNTPFFLYNILVFGNKSCCGNLATKIVSLLQNGEKKVVISNPICLDLSSEKIKLVEQFPYYVWNINNRLLYHYRNKNLQVAVPLAKKLFRLQYMLSIEEAVSFFRVPLFDKNMIALRNNQLSVAYEQFSKLVVDEQNIQIGCLAGSEQIKVMIGCPEKAFTKHALIVGTPGSGKTTFSVNLLLQFADRKIPFLAIEPTKTEYRALIDTVPGLRIFTPGNNDVAPFIINPFIPPKGIRVEQYIPSLVNAFKAAFSMPSPLDMIFLKAIRNCYTQYGWKDYSKSGDDDVQVFGLHEFICVFKQLIAGTSYSKDVRGNLESAGLLRLTNLIEQNSNIYDTINTIPIEDLLTQPTILELNAIDNIEQKSLIMALLLVNICLYTKNNQIGDGELKNVLLIDEAHVLLGGKASRSEDGADSQASTVKALQDMIAEIRSYGTSIIIADQSPTKVSREVVANTDIKVSFRLVQSAEKELIADSSNMDDETKNRLSKLQPGEAYVYYSQLDAPQMVITEDIREKRGIRLSVSNSEIADKLTYWKQNASALRPYEECKYCRLCNTSCDFKVRSNAEFIANSAFAKYQKELQSTDNLKKCLYHLPSLMKAEIDRCKLVDIEKLYVCARIKLLRKTELEFGKRLTENEKEKVFTLIPE